MHERKNDGSIQVIVPASGLVTALEPCCSPPTAPGSPHGSGDADRDTVDAHDRIRVPPDNPAYTLRRVWLSTEEEKGYYDGFANEGIWPLCHIAHTRPIFRPEDWQSLSGSEPQFADAVLEEMEGVESPIVLVQDYHFALLPRMVKEARPDARVAIFWHIPWPNPEVFGICPWQRELLDGLLGADLIGFHIQSHCNNFLRDGRSHPRSAHRVGALRRSTARPPDAVRPYPISVAMSDARRPSTRRSAPNERVTQHLQAS